MGRRWTANKATSGFTLLELIVVLIIAGLLTGMVIISVRSHVDRARLESAVDLMAVIDRRLRRDTRQHHASADWAVSAKGRVVSVDADFPLKWNRERTLPRSISVRSIRAQQGGLIRKVSRVKYSAQGHARPFAVQLVSEAGAHTWLVSLGRTGQALRCESQEEADALLRP